MMLVEEGYCTKLLINMFNAIQFFNHLGKVSFLVMCHGVAKSGTGVFLHFAKMNCLLIFVPIFFTLFRCFVAWKGHDEKNGFTV
ncbi:hypothetical protein, partial [Xenorhabdus mauleonii]|uniref:hypothetical protein n=2 Tax=Xenorhabdus mauleonii TaxID=351675 RepID=UPI0030D9CEEC